MHFLIEKVVQFGLLCNFLPVFLLSLPFSRRVRVPSLRIIRTNITKPIVIIHTMCAPYYKFRFTLRLFSHLTDAQTTNVVLATTTHQNSIEIAQTDWTSILVFTGLIRVKSLNVLDVAFAYSSLDSNFVSSSDLLQV